VVRAASPKYGLATLTAHPYAPPISEPHSTTGHPSGADALHAHRKANDHMGSMAVNELGPMLTATEVAEMLHLHVNTVKRLGDRGELPFYRVCKRGDRRFRLDDVMKFLAQNR
jgi:excisionase family DNA binding protein